MKIKYTPWGKVQSSTHIGRGIYSTSCDNHGGLYVPDSTLNDMPMALRCNSFGGGNWFEEDCEWALIALAFPDLFSPYAVWLAGRTVRQYDTYAEAAKWLDSEAGEQVAALIHDYYAAHADHFHVGCISTAGNKWDCRATSLDGTRSIRFKCAEYPGSNEAFSLEDLQKLNAEVSHE